MVIICQLLQVYSLVLFARAISTWFPVRPDGPGAQVVGVLVRLTEPVLAPARRIIPPIGMIDISFLVVIIGVQVLRGIICS